MEKKKEEQEEVKQETAMQKQEALEQKIENDGKKEKNEKVQSNKEPKAKKSKKKHIIITIVILFILIALGIGGYFLYKYKELKSPIDVSWGETYYAYLKSATIDGTKSKEEIGFEDGMENIKLEFIQVEDRQKPVMIVTYNKQDETYNNIYSINNNAVNYIKIDDPSDIELLYSIKEKSYHLYVHTQDEEEDNYEPLYNIVNIDDDKDLPEYTIEKGEKTTQKTVDGDKITISKYDETFIKPDVTTNNKIDFNTELDEKTTKEIIENAVHNYTEVYTILTDEVKNKVEQKLEEVQNKLDDIEKAKKEIEKKKAEEEARKKAAREKVKNGIYYMEVGADSVALSKGDVYLEINGNNITIYNNFAQIVEEGTFEVKDDKLVGTYTKIMYLDHQNGGRTTEKNINDEIDFDILKDGSLRDNNGIGESLGNSLLKGKIYSR